MIDYTGKLNDRFKYIKILDEFEVKTKYIEIVLVDEKKTNHLVEKFKDNVINESIVSEWWGTKTSAQNKLIKISSSKELFEYLKKFETFCKYYSSYTRGDYSEITDFGYDDIAFYDNDDNMLFCTTTHEGYILIDKSLIK